MDFDVFDKEMRRFEQSLDRLIPDDVYLVARLDGRVLLRREKIPDTLCLDVFLRHQKVLYICV